MCPQGLDHVRISGHGGCHEHLPDQLQFLFGCRTCACGQAQTTLSLSDQETFLRTAAVVEPPHGINKGVTNSRYATLEKDGVKHRVHVQTIDEARTQFQSLRGSELNFKDTYKFNIAAYELAKLLGIEDMVPPSVERREFGKTGSFTWWVDDVVMDETKRQDEKIQPPDLDRWNRQMHVVRVFDQLISNTDRNIGNVPIDKSWNIWMIDHTRAFRMPKQLQAPKNLVQCDRQLLARLRALDKATVQEKLGATHLLTNMEIDGLLARREKIVKYFDDQVKASGVNAVLYDRPSR